MQLNLVPLSFEALVLNTPNAKNLNIALADKDGESDFFVSNRKADSSLIEPKKGLEKNYGENHYNRFHIQEL